MYGVYVCKLPERLRVYNNDNFPTRRRRMEYAALTHLMPFIAHASAAQSAIEAVPTDNT